MDTSDPEIEFDANGLCHHCRGHRARLAKFRLQGAAGEAALEQLVRDCRRVGRGKPYDCVIGISGGVDSSYTAYKVKSLGLRPIAVHLDNGWDTVEAVTNIQRVLTALEIDLHTVVLDWPEFRDLQLAFLQASTPDSEIPTDHAIGAVMLHTAAKFGLRHVIAGQNLQSEGLGPPAWSQGYHDWLYIRSVHQRFGHVPLRTYPHYGVLEHVFLKVVRGIRRVDFLNWLPYDKEQAKQLLVERFGWQSYGGKHHESVYTRFFQSYILPVKFGYDKRRAHLSTLISSGLMTREQALEEIAKPPCSAQQLAADRLFVIKKLGLTEAQFDAIMALPRKTIFDYPSYERSRLYHFLKGHYRRAVGTTWVSE
jgi:N-acetyl sugar amidotransferase